MSAMPTCCPSPLPVVGVTVLTYATTPLVQRFVILYGKRLFSAVVMSGVLPSA